MQTLLFILVFILGSIIGSFLNVVILRCGTGRGLGGRSKCAVTGKTLKWFELIPIVSFLIQGGRSRYSKTKISWQYPLVEFFTGLSFVLITSKFMYLLPTAIPTFIASIVFFFAVVSVLIVIFVYDLRHKIIPDAFLIPLFILSITYILFFSEGICVGLHVPKLLSILAGPIVALPLFCLWFLTKGRGMGFGDVLLAIPFGLILGISSGFASLLLSFWIGALVGLMLLGARTARWKSEIPFGPFLILGFMLVFLYNIDMVSIARFFAGLI